jgi:hypothetical protein
MKWLTLKSGHEILGDGEDLCIDRIVVFDGNGGTHGRILFVENECVCRGYCARHLAEWKSFVCGFVAARLFLAGVSHIS